MLPASWPPPSGSPVGTWGWYRASDGRWYRSETAPAPGWVVGASGRWVPADDPDAARTDEAWWRSRWGLGDAWWGALAYVACSLC